MDIDFWKNAYKDTWNKASEREKQLANLIYRKTGKKVIPYGLGAETDEFIHGSAEDNGLKKGDADLNIEGTNIFLEVTGPLSNFVKSNKPLWFRPDKIENAKINIYSHDTFLVHNCPSENLWRVIHINSDFVRRFDAGEFQIVTPKIRGNTEKYIEISSTDDCVKNISILILYIRNKDKKKKCPMCGNDLVIRTAHRGYRIGKNFWGCSSFPKCRYTENIE